MKKITSTISLLLFFYSITFAIDFKGIIKDEVTQLPIAGATIRVYKNTDQVASAKSNDEGYFTIPLLMGNDYKVYIDKNSYEQLRVSITTNFSASITELPSLELQMVKTKINPESTVPIVRLTGKLYHLQVGGLEGEQINAKNNLSGSIITAFTQSNGNYTLQLTPNTNYTITVTTNGSYPEYEYAPIFLNTSGINFSIQIIRNFENRGVIVKEDIKAVVNPQKIMANKDKEPETKTETIDSKVTKTESKNSISESKQTPILTDKDKALINALNSKYEKLVIADSVERKKDNMVARNVVVKFYDEDKKEDEKKVTIPSVVQAVEKPKTIEKKEKVVIAQKSTELKKDTQNTKVLQAKERVIEAKTTDPVKKIKVDTNTKKQETVVSEVTTVSKPVENTQKLIEKNLEAKRIDSMIGTAPRFMHRDLTSAEKAKLDATKINNSTSTDNRLPILIDEDRTPVINDKIYYGEGKASLDNEAVKYLTDIASKLKANADVKIEVAVNCDSKDEASVADYICKLRIKRIVDLMINQLGVNFQQLTIRSVGINDPVNTCKKESPNCSDLDHQMNRRTEIKYLN